MGLHARQAVSPDIPVLNSASALEIITLTNEHSKVPALMSPFDKKPRLSAVVAKWKEAFPLIITAPPSKNKAIFPTSIVSIPHRLFPTTEILLIHIMATVQKKTVLITGCSAGGIGWAMAKHFHQRGYYVFATLRNPSSAEFHDDGMDIEFLELDVTAPKTIAQCKEIVAKRTGGRLDVLVNNAGIEFNSPLLDTDLETAKRLFDVNVWGLLAMVQVFAPLLVEAKGVVFNQSSIDKELNMVWAGKLGLFFVRHKTQSPGRVNSPNPTIPIV